MPVAKIKLTYKNAKRPDEEFGVSNFGITGVFFWFEPVDKKGTTTFVPSDEISHVEIIKPEGA